MENIIHIIGNGKTMGIKRTTISILIFSLLVSSACLGFLSCLPKDVEPQKKASVQALADSPWPCYLGDRKHTGLASDGSFQTNGSVKWKFDTGNFVMDSTIGIDGSIYADISGTGTGILYALHPNGTLNWSYSIGSSVSTCTAIGSDGTIYFGAEFSPTHGELVALHSNGTLNWSYVTSKVIGSSPNIADDGTIYFGCRDQRLYALHPNGTLKWSFLSGGQVDSSPAIADDGTIFFGSYDKRLYALYPNGTLKWSYLTIGTVYGSPAIADDGTIYIGSGSTMYALYPNGTLRWTFGAGGSLGMNSVAIGSNGEIYFGCENYWLYALHPDGTFFWKYQTLGYIDSSPAIGGDGVIYFGSWDEWIYAVYPNGSLKWKYQTNYTVYAAPTIGSDGTVYFSFGWSVYAFSAFAIPPDTTPPITTPKLSGTAGSNSWYISPVTIWLNASDVGNGVNWTEYRINGSSWENFTAPLTINKNGNYTLDFYSADILGNCESTRSITIKIDRDAPITTASVVGSIVTIAALDSISGVNRTLYRIDLGLWHVYSGEINVSLPGNHSVEFYTVDNASNEESIKTIWVENISPPSPPQDYTLLVYAATLLVGAIAAIVTIFTIIRNRKKENEGPRT